MGLVKADAKIRIKRAELLGVEPTTGPSLDHTDGSWNDTDIYTAEFMMNTGQPGVTGSVERLWVRTEEAIRNIPLVTNGGSAGQMLVLDNDNDTCSWTDIPSDAVGFEIAENGLYAVSGTTVRIGGPIIENTNIDGGSYSFTFDSDAAGIEYGSQFHSNYTLRSLVDKEYVDLAIGGISVGGVTAFNGLTQSGSDIKLGGELVETTVIHGSGSNFQIETEYVVIDTKASLNLTSGFDLRQTQGTKLAHVSSDLEGGDGIGLSLFDYATSEYQGVSVETGHFVEIGSILGPLYTNQGHAFIRTSYLPGEFLIVDGRTGSSNVGIEYDDDYSANYTDRSLIDYQQSYSHIGKSDLDPSAYNPTASNDGQALIWDNTGNQYTLASVGGLTPNRDIITLTTTNATPTSMLNIPISFGNGVTYKVIIKGVVSGTPNIRVIGGDMLFTAATNFGSTFFIGGVDHSMKSNFATAYFDAVVNGSSIDIEVTGESATTINWEAIVEYV